MAVQKIQGFIESCNHLGLKDLQDNVIVCHLTFLFDATSLQSSLVISTGNCLKGSCSEEVSVSFLRWQVMGHREMA